MNKNSEKQFLLSEVSYRFSASSSGLLILNKQQSVEHVSQEVHARYDDEIDKTDLGFWD